ncbi:MAG: adenylate kinase, partial [Candidatus Caldatribacterium sp.]|nr:adenylate kinase [Candidatus Caldatribacterium sp.]
EQTKPLVDFYKARGLLFVVPSSGTIEETYARVREILAKKLPNG